MAVKRVKARANADAVQLRAELAGVLPPEAVEQVNGDVYLNIPDTVDEVQAVRIMQRHFPRGLMRDVWDALNAVDYQTPTTLAALRAEMQKHLAADKLLARAIKTRWED